MSHGPKNTNCCTLRTDEDIKEDETELYINQTASDLINIIVGNALSEFGKHDLAIKISTPLTMRETEFLYSFSDINALSAKIETEFGQLRVLCIFPGNALITKI